MVYADDESPEEGTEEWRQTVLHHMLADKYRPKETTTYHDLVLRRSDTPERVFTVHRRDPADPEEFDYLTTINISGFNDARELARHLGSIETV